MNDNIISYEDSTLDIGDSILLTVKQLIGAPIGDEFDPDIIAAINTAIAILYQKGVCKSVVSITDAMTNWSDMNIDDRALPIVKNYMANKVRLIFDPPTNTNLYNALKNQTDEFEFYAMFLSSSEQPFE